MIRSEKRKFRPLFFSLMANSIASRLVVLSRRTKRTVMVISDAGVIPGCLAFSLWLVAPASAVWWSLWPWLTSVGVALFCLVHYGLYRSVVRFMGLELVIAAFKIAVITTVAVVISIFLISSSLVALKTGTIFGLSTLLYLAGSRFSARLFLQRRSVTGDRVVIYGAGSFGAHLSSAISGGGKFIPVAFVDDNHALQGTVVDGLEIYSPSFLPELVSSLGVSRVLLALPSVSRRRRREIIDGLEGLQIHVQTMPDISDLISGAAQVTEIAEVNAADLLDRDAVPPDKKLLVAGIHEKSVMVTGAGGSIGSELCRQIVRLGPRRLVTFDCSEAALYTIDRILKEIIEQNDFDVEVVSLIGSVDSKSRMLDVLQAYDIETVYHAAAYKHVTLVESNMLEGIQNNVFGTLYAAQAAMVSGVESFVLISTDKAVSPTNVMGASKRLSELVLQGLNTCDTRTVFSMVRFGNVLGSSGSVIPLFRQQIRDGGPVTVTHPNVDRYFMTIPEAAELVLQAGSMAKGGDVFVLDMGKPVRIVDLAKKMIHLMGRTVKDQSEPDGDVEIKYIGLQPGEKLHEQLLIGRNVGGTAHKRILRAQEDFIEWDIFKPLLDQLSEACDKADCKRAQKLLIKGVKGYSTDNSQLEDLVWRENDIRNREPGRVSHKVTGNVTALNISPKASKRGNT